MLGRYMTIIDNIFHATKKALFRQVGVLKIIFVRPSLCLSCEQPFIPDLDEDLCNVCINAAYEHEPNLYAKVIWPGNGSVTVSLHDAPETIKYLMDGLSEGDMFQVVMVEMSAAEYRELPDFGGW